MEPRVLSELFASAPMSDPITEAPLWPPIEPDMTSECSIDARDEDTAGSVPSLS